MAFGFKSEKTDHAIGHRKKSLGRKILDSFMLSILIACIAIGIGYFLYTFKTDRYQITGVKHSNQKNISQIIENEIESEALIKINTDSLKAEILKNSPLIKDINISKSLSGGIIVNIQEYEPIILIQTMNDKRYFLTKEETYLDITELAESDFSTYPIYYYLEVIPDDENIYTFAEKVREAREKVESLNLNGRFSFDNFGNLSILMGESKVIKLDLKERFFTIDEQVKLLQDALVKTQSFTEIDLRFTYLLIK